MKNSILKNNALSREEMKQIHGGRSWVVCAWRHWVKGTVRTRTQFDDCRHKTRHSEELEKSQEDVQ